MANIDTWEDDAIEQLIEVLELALQKEAGFVISKSEIDEAVSTFVNERPAIRYNGLASNAKSAFLSYCRGLGMPV